MGRFDIRTRTGQISAIIQGQSATDADAQAYFDRVTAAGGTLSLTEQNAVNTLVLSLKSANIWTAMKAIYPMVGSSAAACAQNLKSSSYTGTFTSGWTFTANGATPNGTSAFMNTGLAPNTQLTNNNIHYSYYSRTQITSTSATEMGSLNSGNVNQNSLGFYFAATSQKTFVAGGYPTYSAISSNSDTLGLVLGSRISTTSAKIYMDGILLATNTTTNVTTLPIIVVYLGGVNNNGALIEPSNKQCAFASIGDGLSDAQVTNFYTSVQAFQTILSRQV
ncbi:MAG: hypothetical protein ACOVJ8_10840 [Sediminibacterium sp.]